MKACQTIVLPLDDRILMTKETKETTEIKPFTPGFAGAVFFAIFGLCFLIFAKYTLLSLATNLNLPMFPAVLLVLITGAYLGSYFGEALAKCKTWYHALLIGCFMAVLGILFISLSTMVRAWIFDTGVYDKLHGWRDYVVVYGLLVASITLLAGVWLIPLTGLAAIYFNKHFLPRLLLVSQRQAKNDKQADE